MTDLGRILLTIGTFLVLVGIIMSLLGTTALPRLPGDIYMKKDNFTFYFPVVTSLVVSIVLTILLNIFLRK